MMRPSQPTWRIEIKDFNRLTLRELYDLLVLRNIVFVVGQKITSEPEADGLDDECSHALLYSGDDLIATARIFLGKKPIVVGRIAVHPDHQRTGVGTGLMEHLQRYLADRPAEMHAQAHLEEWYTRLGWRRVGDLYEEAQIPHVTMVRP
jgi:ElaA protein